MNRSAVRQLLAGNLIAFVCASAPVAAYADPSDEPASPQDGTPIIAEEVDGPHYVSWAYAHVRAAPSGTAEILDTLPFGSQLTVTGRVQGRSWLRVQLNDGSQAFVWAQILRPLLITVQEPAPDAASMPLNSHGNDNDEEPSADNSMSEAVMLGVLSDEPIRRRGSVGPADETDYFRFEVPGWTSIDARLDQLSADADLRLRDQDGNILMESRAGNTDPEHIVMLAGPGDYFAEVYRYEGATPYRLILNGEAANAPPADEAGNDVGSARDLGDAGVTTLQATDWVGQIDKKDYYRFHVAEPSMVTVRLHDLQADADISVEDDFGSVLATSTEGGSRPEQIDVRLESGYYFVLIVPFAGSTNYTVEILARPVVAEEGGAAPDPQDQPS